MSSSKDTHHNHRLTQPIVHSRLQRANSKELRATIRKQRAENTERASLSTDNEQKQRISQLTSFGLLSEMNVTLILMTFKRSSAGEALIALVLIQARNFSKVASRVATSGDWKPCRMSFMTALLLA
jgi:hypothetical protein